MVGRNGERGGRLWGRDGEWTETEWGNQYGMGAQSRAGEDGEGWHGTTLSSSSQ
jgi:hypothetical protein